MIIGESVLELSVVMYLWTASKSLFSWIIPTSKMDRWLQICNIDIMKFMSTFYLWIWNSRVCRLWLNWISFNSSCLKTFLFWNASIIIKLFSLKISLICCCLRFWFDMSMSMLCLSHWTFSLVLPHPLKSDLKILPKQIFWPLWFLCFCTWIVIRDQV